MRKFPGTSLSERSLTMLLNVPVNDKTAGVYELEILSRPFKQVVKNIILKKRVLGQSHMIRV